MRLLVLALLASGCLAAPPPTDDDGADGVGGDDGHGDDPASPPDGGEVGGGAGCAPGTALDLVWVSELAFDQTAQDQVTLRGLAIAVNPGPETLDIGAGSVVSWGAGGAVEADFTLVGGDLSLPPGQAMGALNTGAALALARFDEEWTNLHSPELDLVLRFDGSGVDTEIPLQIQLGGYLFDLSVLVVHETLPSGGFEWAREAQRATASCP